MKIKSLSGMKEYTSSSFKLAINAETLLERIKGLSSSGSGAIGGAIHLTERQKEILY